MLMRYTRETLFDIHGVSRWAAFNMHNHLRSLARLLDSPITCRPTDLSSTSR